MKIPRTDVVGSLLRPPELLKAREPERFARMLASVDAGRTDTVIDALLTYYG